jgi:hypothetical protein
MANVNVACAGGGDGWRCEVTVTELGGETRHSVTVTHDDLASLAPGDASPDRLARLSFEFLLEREPKESILRSFELPVIGRYFPEYRREIRRRLEG